MEQFKPFFSIIIPCFNSNDVLGTLLESIVQQGEITNIIEVIISDDRSTEPYADVINYYADKLHIKFIQTDYNFGPGNTRQKGLIIADGEWITFADHDDIYLPNAFTSVYDAIHDNNEKYMVTSNFIEYSVNENKILREMIKTDNWLHGKFYNMNNLIKPFNIHFKKDLRTHEDIYFSSCVACALHTLDILPLFIDNFTYVWNARPSTISRRTYCGDKGFLESFFNDYIVSTGDVFIDFYKTEKIDIDYAIAGSLSSLLYSYFYIQGFKHHNPTGYDKDNIFIVRDFFIRIKNVFNLTNEEIFNIYMLNTDMYVHIREGAYIGIGKFIETDSLKSFINSLENNIHALL